MCVCDRGRNVYKGLGGKVPIGLVEAAWGGTRIEAWMTPQALARCPGTDTAKCGHCCRDPWCKTSDPAGTCQRMNSANSGARRGCHASAGGGAHPHCV